MTSLKEHKEYVKWCNEQGYTPIGEKQYKTAVKEANRAAADAIIEGEIVRLPFNMGMLFAYETKLDYIYVDKETGETKIKGNLPIDWDSTKKLWAKDEEAKKERKFIRFTDRNSLRRFKVRWDRFRVKAVARNYFKLRPMGTMLKVIGRKGRNDEVVYMKF